MNSETDCRSLTRQLATKHQTAVCSPIPRGMGKRNGYKGKLVV